VCSLAQGRILAQTSVHCADAQTPPARNHPNVILRRIIHKFARLCRASSIRRKRRHRRARIRECVLEVGRKDIQLVSRQRSESRAGEISCSESGPARPVVRQPLDAPSPANPATWAPASTASLPVPTHRTASPSRSIKKCRRQFSAITARPALAVGNHHVSLVVHCLIEDQVIAFRSAFARPKSARSSRIEGRILLDLPLAPVCSVRFSAANAIVRAVAATKKPMSPIGNHRSPEEHSRGPGTRCTPRRSPPARKTASAHRHTLHTDQIEIKTKRTAQNEDASTLPELGFLVTL